jgi:hypothetical protein
MDGVNIGDGEGLRETAEAVLIYLDDVGDEVWIPRSQIHESSDVQDEGDVGSVVVTNWLAKERGWS